MKYKDFPINDYLGKKIWVCDYRFNNKYIEKPIRHIKPTEVVVFSNSDLPKNKRVYYAMYHFRPLNKKHEPTNKIIAPCDNTGYRAMSGTFLQCFTNKEECYKYYNDICNDIIEKTLIEKALIEKQYYNFIESVEIEQLKYII